MKLYVHKKTVRYLDYGDLLSTEHGIAWSSDGDPQNASGFEEGVTVEDARARFSAVQVNTTEPTEPWELIEGPAITRTHDMNPHGLI